MRAGIVDITIEQGANYSRVFENYAAPDDPESDEVGPPISFTAGTTAKMQIRKRKESPTTLMELKSQDSEILIAGNQLTLLAGFAKTAALNFDEAYYDVKLYNADGTFKERFIQGTVKLDRETTRP